MTTHVNCQALSRAPKYIDMSSLVWVGYHSGRLLPSAVELGFFSTSHCSLWVSVGKFPPAFISMHVKRENHKCVLAKVEGSGSVRSVSPRAVGAWSQKGFLEDLSDVLCFGYGRW